MPTPAGHTVAALAVWTASRPWTLRAIASPWLWLVLLSASAPDLDFLPGILLGNESLFHRGAGHSLAGSFLYGLSVLVPALILTRSWRKALQAAALGAGLFLSHLLLDLVGRDPSPPHGIQVFWPFSDVYLVSPWHLFPHLERHPFDWSVIPRAIPVVAAEVVLLVPLLLAARGLRLRREGRKSRSS